MRIDEIDIVKETTPTGTRLILRGRIGLTNAPTLQFELDELVKKEEIHIILNMCQVSFLSSAGIRVILKTHRVVTEMGGCLGIEDPSENVKNVIGMVALDELLV